MIIVIIIIIIIIVVVVERSASLIQCSYVLRNETWLTVPLKPIDEVQPTSRPYVIK